MTKEEKVPDYSTIRIKNNIRSELDNLKVEAESYSVVISKLLEENTELKSDKETLSEALSTERTDSEKKLYEDILKKLNILPNIFTLDGVENLLNLNVFNEVPTVLINAYSHYIQLALMSDKVLESYSKPTAELYVEKAEKLSNNLLAFVNEYNISEDSDIGTAIEHYVNYLKIRIDFIKLNHNL